MTFTSMRQSMLIGCIVFFAACNLARNKADGIYAYEPKYDRQFILDSFSRDWHWLVSEDCTDFDPAYVIDTMQPAYDGKNFQLYVYQLQQKPVAFVAFYTKQDGSGYLNFLDVHPNARGHGIAHTLVQFAVKKMEQLGLKCVDITTRVSNSAALAVYRKAGFIERRRDSRFVYLKKTFNF